jgi:EAL and modified HD-GYP domain-containing signal transduction protein
MDVFIARQPIFDSKDQVQGYELLYRKNSQNSFDLNTTGDLATSMLLMNSYYTFGINRLSEGKKVYINFDKNLIEADIPTVLNKDLVVIEISANEPIFPSYKDKIKSLKNEGFTIAIDNYAENTFGDSITDICDIIKVDFLSNTKKEITKIVKKWKNTNKMLIAEKVETHEIFDWANSIGFDLFQGYYFSKPKIIKGQGLLTSNTSYIHIMEELTKQDPDYSTIAKIIESDTILTYRILKLVNANFVSYNKISSVKQALVTLGLKDFEKWVALAMIQDLSKNKPPELLKLAMLRGKFLELLIAKSMPNQLESEGMLIGVLSILDALTNRNMEDILIELPLSEGIKKPLLLLESPYTHFYKVILNIEKGNYGLAFDYLNKANLYVENLMELYYTSIEWAADMYAVLNENNL